MKISVLTVGKIKEKFYTEAINEYSKRLSRYCKLEIVQVPDEKTVENCSEIEADIVKQKLPVNNGGFTAIKFGKTNDKVYTELTSEHPIDLCRYQVANGYMGRVGLINSGGESHGSSDLKDAVITAIVNKRAGGMGLISGRKAFQKPMKDGIELLNTIQDVYLDSSITIA